MAGSIFLNQAPIVEALIQFQANTAERWLPERMQERLQPAWPEHTQVQEVRPVQFEIKQELGKEPEQKVTFPSTEAFVFRGPDKPTVYQARRDGLIVSWLAPYENWSIFRTAAFDAWAKFQRILAPEPLHSVALRYINRLEFPLENFRLDKFFTVPPAKPPEIGDWGFHGFQHHTDFGIPNSGCGVQVVFTRIECPPETVAFIIDINVRLKESLESTGRTAEAVLEEMRILKDKAFFSMLTQEAISRYT